MLLAVVLATGEATKLGTPLLLPVPELLAGIAAL